MIEEIYKVFPKLANIDENVLSKERIVELNKELSELCNWCLGSGDTHCKVCLALEECALNETIDWEEEEKALQRYYDEEAQRRREELDTLFDPWANNIGECEAHFWGVCEGEMKGHPCKHPSKYGCSFKP